jgi:sporulation protein YlmC with PRC-barrel domain
MSGPRFFRKDEVEGKSVIFSSGRIAGKVKDVVFGLDGTIVLVVENENDSEARVPMSMVMGVADYVVVNDEIWIPASKSIISSSGQSGSAGMVLKFCNNAISPGTIYCPSCDRSQV